MSVPSSITGRVVNGDIAIMSVGGEDVVALFREANWEMTVDEIDVSAAHDEWKQREYGLKDWRFTCTKLISVSQVFGTLVVASGLCVIQCDIGESVFTGTGMIPSTTLNAGDPQTESITVVSAGGSPTLV